MSKPYVLIAIGYARPDMRCEFAGQYLARYDPNAPNDERGLAEFTTNPAEAMRFADPFEALNVWNQERTVGPGRWDGQPDRPLTALTVSIEKLPEMA